jgi:hypothetical protein
VGERVHAARRIVLVGCRHDAARGRPGAVRQVDAVDDDSGVRPVDDGHVVAGDAELQSGLLPQLERDVAIGTPFDVQDAV